MFFLYFHARYIVVYNTIDEPYTGTAYLNRFKSPSRT